MVVNGSYLFPLHLLKIKGGKLVTYTPEGCFREIMDPYCLSQEMAYL